MKSIYIYFVGEKADIYYKENSKNLTYKKLEKEI